MSSGDGPSQGHLYAQTESPSKSSPTATTSAAAAAAASQMSFRRHDYAHSQRMSRHANCFYQP